MTKKIDEQREYKVFCKKCDLCLETSIFEHNKKHDVVTKEEYEETYQKIKNLELQCDSIDYLLFNK
jgi:hypothetical protein